jgi:hypothetical protein
MAPIENEKVCLLQFINTIEKVFLTTLHTKHRKDLVLSTQETKKEFSHDQNLQTEYGQFLSAGQWTFPGLFSPSQQKIFQLSRATMENEKVSLLQLVSTIEKVFSPSCTRYTKPIWYCQPKKLKKKFTPTKTSETK